MAPASTSASGATESCRWSLVVYKLLASLLLGFALYSQVATMLDIRQRVQRDIEDSQKEFRKNGIASYTPKIDEQMFQYKVAMPQQEMVELFPRHPNIVISKLRNLVRQELEGIQDMQQQVEKIKESPLMLGMTLGAQPRDGEAPASAGARLIRTKRSWGWGAIQEDTPWCSPGPPLAGPLFVFRDEDEVPHLDDPSSREFLDWYGRELGKGGTWRPQGCRPRQKLALVIPYRDRDKLLRIFLYNIHPFLQRQNLDYMILVVEQSSAERFNRGALLNIGFAEARKLGDYDCFIFQDVDLLPEDDRIMYTCPEPDEKVAKHLSVAIDKTNYRILYNSYFGGVTALSKTQFEAINGFSNNFYGWGGEDDDLYNRIVGNGLSAQHIPAQIGRYIMLKHDKVEMNKDLKELMHISTEEKGKSENGLSSLKYTVLKLDQEGPLFTKVTVELPKAPIFPKVETTTTPRPSFWENLDQTLNKMGQMVAGISLKEKDVSTNSLDINESADQEDSVY